MKPKIILSFFYRYVALLLVTVLAVWADHYDSVTYLVGPTFYVLKYVLAAVVVTLLAIHLVMRNTMDKYKQEDASGTSPFIRDWTELDGRTKLILSLITFWVLFLGSAWIASNVVK
jgi:hypothetical protein